jgi:class 3 adenylate cyclase
MGRSGRGIAAPRAAGIGYARLHLGFLAGVLLAAAAIGIAYRYLFDSLDLRTLPNFIRSALHAIGLACSGWAVYLMFDAVPRSRVAGAVRRLPLAAEFAAKALVMTAVLTIVAVGLEFALYPPPPRRWFDEGLPRIVAIAFVVSLLVGAIFELRRLVGGPALGSLLLGTYHRPRRERRIVMFLDIEASTALAERMGELRVHDLITEFFFDIDQAIAEHGGEVHAYVGDAVIVNWPLSDDPGRNARALRCFFAAEDRMTELTPAYARKFGVAPRFRAGVHAGPVVISECGDTKRQIAYFGDTMNVAARLCDHCTTAREALLVSADLLRAAAVPPGFDVGTGASIALRGRQAPVAAHAVRRTGAASLSS